MASPKVARLSTDLMKLHPAIKTEWLASEMVAQSKRIRDPAAMDLYEINIKKAPSKKEIELRLLEAGNARHAAPSRRSVATWISLGWQLKRLKLHCSSRSAELEDDQWRHRD
ncbi:hypothetical protein BDR07DRAFT_1502468 [Suillus spraguei]|nr:hypothetical protein BDR07DRAFT_1502468 [Suillus spraguei]